MKPSATVVLNLISRPEGACLWDFQFQHIGRFGARIHELRHLHGYTIDSERCRRHDHHNYIETYRVVTVPMGQLRIGVAG